MKKICFYLIFIFFTINSSFACQLLNVPIGSNVKSASSTFDFLADYNQDVFGENNSALYEDYAADFCDGSDLKETDLEVIVYQSKIAGINLVNADQDNNNLIYEFTKNFINDPGQNVTNKTWTGYVSLDVGNLIITYSKTNVGNQKFEYLEITNTEMFDYTVDENIINTSS